jgi:hypothetical protein
MRVFVLSCALLCLALPAQADSVVKKGGKSYQSPIGQTDEAYRSQPDYRPSGDQSAQGPTNPVDVEPAAGGDESDLSPQGGTPQGSTKALRDQMKLPRKY